MLDLITFQFDKHGGGLVVEIARSPANGLTTPWGERLSPAKIRACDVHPNFRKRLQPRAGGGTDSWFRFDDSEMAVTRQILEKLVQESIWDDVKVADSKPQYPKMA